MNWPEVMGDGYSGGNIIWALLVVLDWRGWEDHDDVDTPPTEFFLKYDCTVRSSTRRSTHPRNSLDFLLRPSLNFRQYAHRPDE